MSSAIRVDPITRVEERIEHVPTPRGALYLWAGRPLEATFCVVICSSVFGDFTANYHRERHLGRVLAEIGLGAIRFHYAGEGNSQGERQAMTFRSLCDDATAVMDHARSLGFEDFALLGTRMGALVAAEIAGQHPSVPLALWEPVENPISFIGEAQRAKRISETAQGRRRETIPWENELEETGKLDLIGYDAYRPLIDSLRGVDLATVLGGAPRQVFVARFSGRAVGEDSLAKSLIERGFEVVSRYFGVSESWWFHSERAQVSDDLIDATALWLSSVLPVERSL